MRIITGKYGGRRLVSFKANHIRPTTDRVKEAIFSKIQFDVEGAKVLDLFSGTGNLAFEALSRGAESVYAVELHPQSIRILKENKKMLGVQEELQVEKNDVLRYLKRENEPFDIIFIDHPFTKKDGS